MYVVHSQNIGFYNFETILVWDTISFSILHNWTVFCFTLDPVPFGTKNKFEPLDFFLVIRNWLWKKNILSSEITTTAAKPLRCQCYGRINRCWTSKPESNSAVFFRITFIVSTYLISSLSLELFSIGFRHERMNFIVFDIKFQLYFEKNLQNSAPKI